MRNWLEDHGEGGREDRINQSRGSSFCRPLGGSVRWGRTRERDSRRLG